MEAEKKSNNASPTAQNPGDLKIWVGPKRQVLRLVVGLAFSVLILSSLAAAFLSFFRVDEFALAFPKIPWHGLTYFLLAALNLLSFAVAVGVSFVAGRLAASRLSKRGIVVLAVAALVLAVAAWWALFLIPKSPETTGLLADLQHRSCIPVAALYYIGPLGCLVYVPFALAGTFLFSISIGAYCAVKRRADPEAIRKRARFIALPALLFAFAAGGLLYAISNEEAEVSVNYSGRQDTVERWEERMCGLLGGEMVNTGCGIARCFNRCQLPGVELGCEGMGCSENMRDDRSNMYDFLGL